MRIPGVKSIAWCPVANVPDEFELQAMAGIKPSLAGMTFTGLVLFGESTLDLEDSNENNGTNRRVSLSFVTGTKLAGKRLAFIVTCNNGAKYLIGTASNVPAVSTIDSYGAPSSDNHLAVTVELSAPMAWIEVYTYTKLSWVVFADGYMGYEKIVLDSEGYILIDVDSVDEDGMAIVKYLYI